MHESTFDGQQQGERILTIITPHPTALLIAIAKIATLAVILFLIICLIVSQLPISLPLVLLIASPLILLVSLLAIGWTWKAHQKTIAYITDRRIIFFEPVTPVYTRQRALFWTEALKAKTYPDSFLGQIFSLHILTVEPQAGSSEDVTIRNVWYAHDLANYIDKILYTVKNTPGEIAQLKPFVAKPKGHRD